MHSAGFRILQLDLSGAENAAAREQSRKMGSDGDEQHAHSYERDVALLINHSYCDVVVFNGVGE
jgi:hypothetical protein